MVFFSFFMFCAKKTRTFFSFAQYITVSCNLACRQEWSPDWDRREGLQAGSNHMGSPWQGTAVQMGAPSSSHAFQEARILQQWRQCSRWIFIRIRCNVWSAFQASTYDPACRVSSVKSWSQWTLRPQSAAHILGAGPLLSYPSRRVYALIWYFVLWVAWIDNCPLSCESEPQLWGHWGIESIDSVFLCLLYNTEYFLLLITDSEWVIWKLVEWTAIQLGLRIAQWWLWLWRMTSDRTQEVWQSSHVSLFVEKGNTEWTHATWLYIYIQFLFGIGVQPAYPGPTLIHCHCLKVLWKYKLQRLVRLCLVQDLKCHVIPEESSKLLRQSLHCLWLLSVL